MENDQQKKIDWWNGETFRHTFTHLAGTIAPAAIVAFVCCFTPYGNLKNFLEEGDFCLFSAAMLAPAVYSFATYKPVEVTTSSSKQEVNARNMWIVSIILIVLSSILFLLIYIHSIYSQFPIYSDAILYVSVFFLIVSISIFYYSKFIHREIEFDINEIAENNFDDFESNYNELK